MKKLLTVLVVFVSSLSAFSQAPYSYSLLPENIPSQEVYRVIQDEKGYIWIGCNAGLFRYDGDSFKQYLNSEMGGRAVSNLEIDPFGRLWCGTFTGQLLFVENDSLKLFEDWSDKEKQFPAFCATSDGVWITSDDGLHLVKPNGNQQHFSLSESSLRNTENVFINSQGRVLAYSNHNGFYGLNASTDKFNELEMPVELSSFKEGRVFIVEWKGKLLALWQRYSDSKTAWVEVLNDSIAPFQPSKRADFTQRVNRVSVGRDGAIWVCTNSGAIRIDENGSRAFLTDQRVSDVIQDREANNWFSTLDNGIIIMPTLDIQNYGEAFFEEKRSNIISLAEGANGNVLLGHFDGTVSSFSPQTEASRTILEGINGKHRASEKMVQTNQTLLVSRGSFSISQNGRLKEIPEGGNAKDFVRLSADTFLIATVDCLSKLYPTSSGKWNRQTLREGACRKVEITSEGEIWAAFKDGVFCGDDQNLQPLLQDGKPVFASDIQVDASDNVWVATISNGLLKVSDGKIIKEFNSSKGLGSDNLHCIALANDTVWIANANGLDRLVNESFQHFGLLDGMPLKEVNDMLVADGFVYLASHSGLTVLPTHTEAENQTAPKLITNAISLGDSLVSKSENTTFIYKFNELKVDLSVLAFRSRGSCKVKYRLSGLDTTWTEQKGNHIEIVYNALPAGSFQFEAFALNEDGLQSEELASFSFTIKPPFWQTWWFYLLVTIASIGIVSGLFLLRIRHINRKAALEHAVVTSKLTALRSQMNPHFLFNALNSIQELVLSKDTKNAIRYLGTFSGLTRTILENSAKETVRLSEEIEMLNQYLELEKLRFGNTLEISMMVDPEVYQEGIRIPPMLIQPYVENALKHGLLHLQNDRKLNLEFNQNDNILEIAITDNGVGRAKAEEIAKQKKKHQSFSSEATENRLQSMKNADGVYGSVEVIDLYENDAASGTKVIIQIPLAQ